MDEEFLTFKRFNDKELAEDFADVLNGKDIAYHIEEDTLVFDPRYSFSPLNKEYFLKIRQQDFPKANAAYDQYFESQLEKVPSDYYLFQFDNEELKEIVSKPDEWGSLDYQLAQKLLKERGEEITAEDIDDLKKTRIKELARPEKEPGISILMVYFICFVFYPAGLVTGWIWAFSKKTLPTGERVHIYNQEVQKHGRIIFALAVTLCILSIILKVTGISYMIFNPFF
jgi:hypothetical protein